MQRLEHHRAVENQSPPSTSEASIIHLDDPGILAASLGNLTRYG